jgi:chemotaxis protein methyltransferase CheR
VTPLDYGFLCRLLRERSGLVLSADKQYLVESRLQPVAQKAGLPNIGALVQKLKGPGADALTNDVVEAMTTNESFFFRDKVPFDLFRNVMLPQLMTARAAQRRIRIWCAAASTGQEPYSLAITLKEMGAKIDGMRFEIFATDLSVEVLEKAKAGFYNQFEVQRGLPIQLLVKYFTQVGDLWQISPEIRSMVQFQQFNLLHAYARLGTFDIVFCRNVLIYFDLPTKAQVLERIASVLAPDGYLVLGAPETVVGVTSAFRTIPEHRGLYAPAAPAQGAGGNVVALEARRVAAAVR